MRKLLAVTGAILLLFIVGSIACSLTRESPNCPVCGEQMHTFFSFPDSMHFGSYECRKCGMVVGDGYDR